MTDNLTNGPWARVAAVLQKDSTELGAGGSPGDDSSGAEGGSGDRASDAVPAATPAAWGAVLELLSGTAPPAGQSPVALDDRPQLAGWDGVAEALAGTTADGTPVGEAVRRGRDGTAGDATAVSLRRRVRQRSMRVLAAGSALLAVLAAGTWLLVAALGGGLPAGVAFQVNGKNVTVSTLDSQVKLLNQLYGVQEPAPSDKTARATFFKTAAKALAVNMLIDDVAASRGISVPEKSARDYLSQLVSQAYAGDQTKLAQALAAAGINQNQLLAEIRHQLLLSKLFAQVVGKVTVTDAQVQAVFKADQAALATPETRTVSHILVSSQAQAESIAGQLKGGASFASLAAQYSLDTSTGSSGGLLGSVSESQLLPAFGKAAFSASPGAPFVVQDPNGWEVGVVTAVNPPKVATDDAATQAAIRSYLTDQVELKRWDGWLSSELRSAHIDYASKYRPANPDAPPPITLPNLAQFVQNLESSSSSNVPVSPAAP